jgi:hypothetical protein
MLDAWNRDWWPVARKIWCQEGNRASYSGDYAGQAENTENLTTDYADCAEQYNQEYALSRAQVNTNLPHEIRATHILRGERGFLSGLEIRDWRLVSSAVPSPLRQGAALSGRPK